MAHGQQKDFCLSVRTKFPERFKGCSVLDIGSLDVNGNNRYLFDDYTYHGIDLGQGNNVDEVCKGHEFTSKKKFDIVISTECFEHDKMWDKTVMNAVKLLRKGGLLMFTCATVGRQEHGTSRMDWSASPHTTTTWGEDYYRNLTEEDFVAIPGFLDSFKGWEFSTNNEVHDLYFYGIRK